MSKLYYEGETVFMTSLHKWREVHFIRSAYAVDYCYKTGKDNLSIKFFKVLHRVFIRSLIFAYLFVYLMKFCQKNVAPLLKNPS